MKPSLMPLSLLLGTALSLLILCLPALLPSVSAQELEAQKSAPGLPASSSDNVGEWLDFSPDVFARARAENKMVLLDLEAVWCHWCHVMAEETYKDAEVRKLLQRKYLCVRVDQDARPDLSNRYEQYGWPATIIFDASGRELVKNAGYINPQAMRKLLRETASPAKKESPPITVSSPSNSKQKAESGTEKYVGLPPAVKEALIKKHKAGYDTKYGGWGTYQKFLDFDSAEFAMSLGLAGDKEESGQARAALDAELNLLDPAFGGLYQYSTDGDWLHPHFEKVMAIQADGLRLYSLGFLLYRDPKYLQAARSIAAYLCQFLSGPEGAFYTSQDADLKQGEHSGDYFGLGRAERLQQGVPRVDRHFYSRENGLAACAFTYLYRASRDPLDLERAIKAVNWVVANRSLAGSPGGFRHDDVDKAGPYLGDNLAMGRAFLALYEVTGERSWLEKAKASADFIGRHFQIDGQAGFVTAASSSSKLQLAALMPQPLLDENVTLARFANLLFQYTGNQIYRDQSLEALRFLSLPDTYNQRRIFVSGILLADGECQSTPLHVTVTGGKDDAAARALFAEAMALPVLYKRTEWLDSKEGPLPNSDVELPALPRAAAFSCGVGRCSRPAYTPEDLSRMVGRLAASNQP
jgi:uncharacterized protein